MVIFLVLEGEFKGSRTSLEDESTYGSPKDATKGKKEDKSGSVMGIL